MQLIEFKDKSLLTRTRDQFDFLKWNLLIDTIKILLVDERL